MKPLSRVSNNRALLVLSALGFLCASSGLVAAQVMGPGDVGTGSGGKKVGNVYYIGTPNGPVRKTQSVKSGPVKNAPVQGRIGGLAVDPFGPVRQYRAQKWGGRAGAGHGPY